MFALFILAASGGLSACLCGSLFKESDLELRNNMLAGAIGGLCMGQYVIELLAVMGLDDVFLVTQILAGSLGGAAFQYLLGYFTNQSVDDI
ncbi:MAG: hypothetical protein AAGA12_12965 [Pseudomonadota bacterium]